MAKAEGPEEFFEALRAAQKDEQVQSAPPSAEEGEEPAPSPTEPAPPESGTDARRFPLSVFAEDEPTITLRRSTLIFAIIAVLILLFIAFALGRRTAKTPRPQTSRTVTRNGMVETRRPALPDRLRNKFVIRLRVFEQADDAGPANARVYRDFLNTSPDAAFIRSRSKEAFIISYQDGGRRELLVCVAPFDGLRGPQVDELLPKLRGLRYNGVAHFENADVILLPTYAKLIQ